MHTGLPIIFALAFLLYKLCTVKKKVLWRDDDPYLIRWTLLKTPLFSLKIHKALISDTAEPHDHPWNYLSIILQGGYWEERTIRYKEAENIPAFGNKTTNIKIIDDGSVFAKTLTWYKPGSVLYRKGNKLHRLVIPEGKFCISLILTTKKFRDWGFLSDGKWVSHTKAGY